MSRKNYKLLDHTADICVLVKAKSLKELFVNSAIAMFDIIASKTRSKSPDFLTIRISQTGSDLQSVFINWLNELLSLSSAKGLIFKDFKIKKLNESKIEAEVRGKSFENYFFNTEIKAATYHELEIKKSHGSWQAKLIFDV